MQDIYLLFEQYLPTITSKTKTMTSHWGLPTILATSLSPDLPTIVWLIPSQISHILEWILHPPSENAPYINFCSTFLENVSYFLVQSLVWDSHLCGYVRASLLISVHSSLSNSGSILPTQTCSFWQLYICPFYLPTKFRIQYYIAYWVTQSAPALCKLRFWWYL